ncbi:MAG: transcriptional regulator [Novosphingobium sp. SCN 66-18]|nr:MAG: transcriptional regulator [Novosphingobium sp. SCN 66-18]
MARYLRLGEKASQLAMTLGQNCRERRAQLKMSQSELSERSGVAASHLSHIENGRGNPTLEVMEKIADALKSSVLELLTDDTYKKK